MLITSPVGAVLCAIYTYILYNARIIAETDRDGLPVSYKDPAVMHNIAIIFAAVMGVCVVLSLLAAFSIIRSKKMFAFLAKGGSVIRGIGYAFAFLGFGGTVAFCFWSYFYITPLFALFTLIFCAAAAYLLSSTFYVVGTAADGGKPTYVAESKLFSTEPIHNANDTRKICPGCGCRTDRHTCPNCGARVD